MLSLAKDTSVEPLVNSKAVISPEIFIHTSRSSSCKNDAWINV